MQRTNKVFLAFDSFSSKHLKGSLLVLLMALLSLAPALLRSQCLCNGNPIQPSDVNYDPVYDANGQITSYTYKFHFPCIGDPLDAGDFFDEYFYYVFYREFGSTEWILVDYIYTSVWDATSDFYLDVPGLKPGVKYEFTCSCPCQYPPFNCPETQFENFDYGNGTYENNVLTPWTNYYCGTEFGPALPWIPNMQVDNIDFNAGTVDISWEYAMQPPGAVKAQYRPWTAPIGPWIDLPDPTGPHYTLTGLTACMEYQFNVTVETPCNANSKLIFFIVSDCSVQITDVTNITGKDATVFWESNSLITPLDYTVNLNSFNTTTPDLSYTFNSLSPRTTYYDLNIIPNCPSNAQCPEKSEGWWFRTNCDRNEPNNSLTTAISVPLESWMSGYNISPSDDVDYYRFVPTCERIQVEIDHELTQPPHDEFNYTTTDLPYKILDENENTILAETFYDEHGFGHYYFPLNPGHVYYLKIGPHSPFFWDPTYQNACYRFRLKECAKCYEENNNSGLMGYETITTLPFGSIYVIDPPFLYSDIQWHVTSGQATLVPTGENSEVYVYVETPGIIVLTATAIRCNGTPVVYSITINASDPCYVSGMYSSFGGYVPLSSINGIITNTYQVILNLPQGTQYFWTCTSGQAYWVVTGNSIKITQTSLNATFQLRVVGECFNHPRTFTFSKPIGAPMPDFRIAPNPVSDYLLIEPGEIPTDASDDELSAVYTVSLFDALGIAVRTQTGNSYEKMLMDCRDLPAGNYFLRITHERMVKTLPVVKI